MEQGPRHDHGIRATDLRHRRGQTVEGRLQPETHRPRHPDRWAKHRRHRLGITRILLPRPQPRPGVAPASPRTTGVAICAPACSPQTGCWAPGANPQPWCPWSSQCKSPRHRLANGLRRESCSTTMFESTTPIAGRGSSGGTAIAGIAVQSVPLTDWPHAGRSARDPTTRTSVRRFHSGIGMTARIAALDVYLVTLAHPAWSGGAI